MKSKKPRWIKFAAVVTGLTLTVPALMGAATYHNAIKIFDGNHRSRMVLSQSNDPLTILKENDVSLSAYDEYELLETGHRMYSLTITRAFDVSLTVSGVEQKVPMLRGTVADVLEKAGVVLGEEDILTPALTDEITPETVIQVQRVTYETEVVSEAIPYETIEQHTPTLQNGIIQQMKAGEEGLRTTTTVRKYLDGVYQETISETVEVAKEPVTEHLLYGDSKASVSTMAIPEGMTLKLDADGNPLDYVQKVSGKATAYTARDGAKTASGRYAMVGHVAVNPNVIPYGSKLYIKTSDGKFVYGYAIAADTGIALMDGRVTVDLFFDTYSECVNFGAKTMDVYVLEVPAK